LRADVYAHVLEQASRKPGVYTFTVPTGGGKTLTYLGFALSHAIANDLDRIICVLPFITVIEQTARVFRQAFGRRRGAVLEHHSMFEHQVGKRQIAAEGKAKLFRDMENWDAPVVVTTAVQFFESLFSAHPSRCRKLHAICNSVIVLDEAQMLPFGLLRPCIAVLKELARACRCSIVLCTATQPALMQPELADGFAAAIELAPDPPKLFRRLRRVRITYTADYREKLIQARQALCIVNVRAHARQLYSATAVDRPESLHLSTLMCAAHRSKVIARIRRDLKADRPCLVIATSLIECGVDLDFPTVFRAEAGLDNIAQAAGRCNREGRRPWEQCHTYVFPVDDNTQVVPAMRANTEVGRRLMELIGDDDPLKPSMIRTYFLELLWRSGKNRLDRHDILHILNERVHGLDFPFDAVEQKMRLVDDYYLPVIVPYGNAAELVEQLRALAGQEKPRLKSVLRRLQPYIVGVTKNDRTKLIENNAAEILEENSLGEQFVWLTDNSRYLENTGLLVYAQHSG